MRPLDPRLLREAKAIRWQLAAMVALALLSTVAVIGLAIGIASFVTSIFVGEKTWQQAGGWLWVVLLAGLMRALFTWQQERLGWRAAGSAKSALRLAVLNQVERQPATVLAGFGTAKLILLITDGLDALDVYFAKFVPQLVYTAVVTPALVALAWWLDPTSGFVFTLTLPLIPIFMILIGRLTQAEQVRQQDALLRLNGHFSEVLRGLATLRIFGRIDSQLATLRSVSVELSQKTMRVLRVSFLSGFALELAASLSVALIAVTIGMRLVAGELDLLTGLIVLVLAPEVYLPLRMIGLQYHAATDGIAASSTVLNQLEAWRSHPAVAISSPLRIDSAAPGELLVISGPSGIGKSSWMVAQATQDPASKSYFAQSDRLISGTVLKNICGPIDQDSVNTQALQQAILHAALDDIELQASVNPGGSGLSGGQQQRVLMARAVYRLFAKQLRELLLDEPTGAIDANRLRRVIEQTQALARSGVAVTVISHQPEWLGAANRHIEVSFSA